MAAKPSKMETKLQEATRLQEKTVTMNEALVLGSLRQHELTVAAAITNELLQGEINERKLTESAQNLVQEQLMDHAGQLEGLVAKRTSELTATNKQLKASVTFIQKGRKEYRLLLLESQAMQKKLSHLTRQIMTAQEEERKKISRELHDGVVQTLIGINIHLSALGKGAPRELRQKMARTQKLVQDAVTEVHQFARELRPAVLDDLGLIPALQAYGRKLEKRKRLQLRLSACSEVEFLGIDERTVLFRVAQEALTNIGRHARATEVEIRFRLVAEAIQMEIADNGKSFPVEKIFLAKNPKRLGIVGMKERVEMVEGSLTIESVPGKGTTVQVRIPFAPEKADQ